MPNIKPGGPTKVRRTLDQEIQGTERAKTDLEKYLEQLYRARTDVAGIFSDTGESRGSRTATLVDILQSAKQPMLVNDIMAELENRGRPDKRNLVGASLDYLAKKGTAKTVERGQWVAVTDKKLSEAA